MMLHNLFTETTTAEMTTGVDLQTTVTADNEAFISESLNLINVDKEAPRQVLIRYLIWHFLWSIKLILSTSW